MPLNKKGKKIKSNMQEHYGKEKGERVFYASENSGKVKGVKKMAVGGMTGYDPTASSASIASAYGGGSSYAAPSYSSGGASVGPTHKVSGMRAPSRTSGGSSSSSSQDAVARQAIGLLGNQGKLTPDQIALFKAGDWQGIVDALGGSPSSGGVLNDLNNSQSVDPGQIFGILGGAFRDRMDEYRSSLEGTPAGRMMDVIGELRTLYPNLRMEGDPLVGLPYTRSGGNIMEGLRG